MRHLTHFSDETERLQGKGAFPLNLVSALGAGKSSAGNSGRKTLGRVTACALAGLLVLSGCLEEEGLAVGEIGYVAGFFGGVAAEEPNAALVGRDVLTAGGSAVDAATAMAFALSVTMPSAASLGSGGACIVHDPGLGITEAITFIPTPGTGQKGDRPTAVPALARGMAAMHSRYGRLDWRQVVAPAEQMARLGHRISRAFARDLARAAKPLFEDREARRIFADASGAPITEGTLLVQPDLAGVLGRVRASGAGVLYNGPFARALVDAYRGAGGQLSMSDLKGYRPKVEPTLVLAHQDSEVHFTPPPAAAGITQAQMWQMLTGGDERYASAEPAQRVHLMAEIMKRALADRKNWLAQGFLSTKPAIDLISSEHAEELMADYDANAPTPGTSLDPSGRQLFEVISGTGFVVADREGNAVACNLTMFNRFGTGRVAPGTGIMLAAAPTGRGRNPLAVGPMVVVSANTFAFRFGVAASGGPLAPAALIHVAAETLLAGRDLGSVIADPRYLALDIPTQVLVEKTQAGQEIGAILSQKGHKVESFDWIGQVTALHCPNGLPAAEKKQVCRVAHDPRGAGLSSVAE